MTSSTSLHDVIVAGAGPVGLFLACELALAGCAVLVLEQAPTPDSPLKQLPFGMRGLSVPSIEALQRRGLFDRLAVPKRIANPFAAGAKRQARQPAGHFAGMQFFLDDVDPTQWPHRLPGAASTSVLAEIAELEAVLAHRAQALGVAIRRGLAVAGVEQDAGSVTVHTNAGAFDARWLVGCDGGRSAVRKAGGFAFAGTEPEFTGYSIHIDLAAPDQLPMGRHTTPRGMYFQSQPGYVGMQDFDGGACHGACDDAGRRPALAHVQAVLRRITGTDVTIRTLHMATTWTDRARQATHYRQGRILLAGDAAHIHSPLGGQGLNLGLGDAMNLGWKLAATVRGDAPPGLLDSYEAERHPVGAQVLDWSRAQVAIMRPTPAGHALQAILRDLMATRDGATYMAGRIWGVQTRYDLGDGHPLVGRSLADGALDDGTTVGEAMRGGQGLLLDATGDAALARWASRYAGRIRHVRPAPHARPGYAAALVRPDGIVAWAIDVAALDDDLQTAADRWFARP
jgi:2-polyprenyl-6-methoxyphenol hydroxylase-like FAD-dependent oxidoreductase